MNRQIALLAGLGAVLLLLGWWFLLYSPKGEEIAAVEAEIETVQAQQVQARNRITQLQDIRTRAPEIEALVNAADAIIPPDPALPAALRQLQMAADAAGVELPTISIARPAEGEEAAAQAMAVSLNISGGYFQIIDFLRRIEDPTIVPRGIIWSSVAVSPSAYPTLTATMTGSMFARNVPDAPAALDEFEADIDTDDDGDADVQIETDTETETEEAA